MNWTALILATITTFLTPTPPNHLRSARPSRAVPPPA